MYFLHEIGLTVGRPHTHLSHNPMMVERHSCHTYSLKLTFKQTVIYTRSKSKWNYCLVFYYCLVKQVLSALAIIVPHFMVKKFNWLILIVQLFRMPTRLNRHPACLYTVYVYIPYIYIIYMYSYIRFFSSRYEHQQTCQKSKVASEYRQTCF
jgi:hypothetical protein